MPKEKKAEKAAAKHKNSEPAELSIDGILAISRAIADPNRFAVLRRISEGTCTSSVELLEGLEIKAATLSHHLRELEAAGLIMTLREGKSVRAALKRKAWKTYVSALKTVVSQ